MRVAYWAVVKAVSRVGESAAEMVAEKEIDSDVAL